MHAGLATDFRTSSQSMQQRAPVKRWEGKFISRTMTLSSQASKRLSWSCWSVYRPTLSRVSWGASDHLRVREQLKATSRCFQDLILILLRPQCHSFWILAPALNSLKVSESFVQCLGLSWSQTRLLPNFFLFALDRCSIRRLSPPVAQSLQWHHASLLLANAGAAKQAACSSDMNCAVFCGEDFDQHPCWTGWHWPSDQPTLSTFWRHVQVPRAWRHRNGAPRPQWSPVMCRRTYRETYFLASFCGIFLLHSVDWREIVNDRRQLIWSHLYLFR